MSFLYTTYYCFILSFHAVCLAGCWNYFIRWRDNSSFIVFFYVFFFCLLRTTCPFLEAILFVLRLVVLWDRFFLASSIVVRLNHGFGCGERTFFDLCVNVNVGGFVTKIVIRRHYERQSVWLCAGRLYNSRVECRVFACVRDDDDTNLCGQPFLFRYLDFFLLAFCITWCWSWGRDAYDIERSMSV